MPEFKTLEELDKFLDDKYKDNEEDEIVEDEIEEEVIEDEEDFDEIEDDEEEEVIEDDDEEEEDEDDEEEDVDPNPKKVDKKEYAFGEMRKNLKVKDDALKEYDDMAIALGYKNGKELIEAYRSQQLEKEAKDKGVDPTFYKEFNDMKTQLANERKLRTAQEQETKIKRFTDTLDSMASDYGLTDNEKANILNAMEDDGYTVEDIIAVKSPKRLLSGYMVDKIAERKVQDKLSNDDKSRYEERRVGKTKKESTDDVDWKDEIAKEMADYARENGLYYKK